MLATKDAALFRQLVKFYETKQYKKGIKNADQVQHPQKHAVIVAHAAHD